MNPEIDHDQMVLISEYYPDGIYSQFVPEQGEAAESPKPRRRRKKNKENEGGGDGALMRKRKLSEEQVNMLERCFGYEHKLESERKDRLAAELGLDPRQVAVWFQNRRARWKSKKLEEEYSKLKSEHENAVVEKCHLHTELMKMKEQLNEAEKEIQRLSADGFSSNSPTSSSFSMAADPPFFGGAGMGVSTGYDQNVFYNYDHDYVHGFEWDTGTGTHTGTLYYM